MLPYLLNCVRVPVRAARATGRVIKRVAKPVGKAVGAAAPHLLRLRGASFLLVCTAAGGLNYWGSQGGGGFYGPVYPGGPGAYEYGGEGWAQEHPPGFGPGGSFFPRRGTGGGALYNVPYSTGPALGSGGLGLPSAAAPFQSAVPGGPGGNTFPGGSLPEAVPEPASKWLFLLALGFLFGVLASGNRRHR